MSHHGPGHHIWLQLPNQGVLQKHQRHAPLPTIAGTTRTQDQDVKGTPNWQIDHIHVCIYIYIYCICTLYVFIYCMGGSICLAVWSRIASIMSISTWTQPRPVLHSLRKNSEKKHLSLHHHHLHSRDSNAPPTLCCNLHSNGTCTNFCFTISD